MAAAALPPPLPPELLQQVSPGGAQAAFAAQGLGQPGPGMDAIQQAIAAVQELERATDDLDLKLRAAQPGLRAHLQFIVNAGLAIKDGLNDLAQRSGAAMGSPVMPPSPVGIPLGGPPNPMGM